MSSKELQFQEALQQDALLDGQWLIKFDEDGIFHDGQAYKLRLKSFQVLTLLVQNPGQVIHTEQFIDRVWDNVNVVENVVKRSISELRTLFGDDPRQPRFIETLARKGYRLICPVEWLTSDQKEPVVFRGLNHYRREDVGSFHGRSALVEQAIKKLMSPVLSEHPFLLVSGESGGGKSSLLRAGIQASVAQRYPGATLSILSADNMSLSDIEQWFEEYERQHERKVQEDILGSPASETTESTTTRMASCCLVIDQFEQIALQSRYQGSPLDAFFKRIMHWLVAAPGNWLILSIRDDCLPLLRNCAAFGRLSSKGQHLYVRSPSVNELREIIESPFLQQNKQFIRDKETGFTASDLILEEVLNIPYQLPVLQLFLKKFHENIADESKITLSHYRDIEGLDVCIAEFAESIFLRLNPSYQACFIQMLPQLVDVHMGRGVVYVRRYLQQSWQSISPEKQLVIDELAKQGLLLKILSADGDVEVGFAHDILLYQWKRLVEWINEHLSMLQLYQRLKVESARWFEQKKSSLFLLEDAVVHQYQKIPAYWLTTENEKAFLAASVKKQRRQSLIKKCAFVSMAGMVVLTTSLLFHVTILNASLTEEMDRATLSKNYVLNIFKSTDPYEGKGFKNAQDMLAYGTKELDSLKNEPDIYCSIAGSLATANANLDEIKTAEKIVHQALSFCGVQYPEHHPLLLDLNNILGDLQLKSGKRVEALQTFKRVYELRTQHHQGDSLKLAESAYHLSRGYLGCLHPYCDRKIASRQGLRLAHQAEALYKANPEADKEHYANVLTLINHFTFFDAEKKVRLARETYRMLKSKYGISHVKTAEALFTLARHQWLFQNSAEAKSNFATAITVLNTLFTKNHKTLLTRQLFYVDYLLDTQQFEQADAVIAEAIMPYTGENKQLERDLQLLSIRRLLVEQRADDALPLIESILGELKREKGVTSTYLFAHRLYWQVQNEARHGKKSLAMWQKEIHDMKRLVSESYNGNQWLIMQHEYWVRVMREAPELFEEDKFLSNWRDVTQKVFSIIYPHQSRTDLAFIQNRMQSICNDGALLNCTNLFTEEENLVGL